MGVGETKKIVAIFEVSTLEFINIYTLLLYAKT